jgi:glycosyltransferase involved in cell wall biosynthesis
VRNYRILICYDIHVDCPIGRIGWAYWRRAEALKKYAPPDFSVDIFQYSEMPWQKCGEYDLVFQIEYASINAKSIKGNHPNVDVPVVVSYNSDARRRQAYWHPAFVQSDFLICNNKEVFNAHGRAPGTCCISNGVDTEVFSPRNPIADRAHKCIFAGSTGPTKQKGWPEVLTPLESLAPQHGFLTDFRPIDRIDPEIVMGTEGTVNWYNSSSYVLCASMSEGTPGIVNEGVACGCVAVSLPVGNILEWGKDRENCVLVERTPKSFLEGLEYAREHRERLSRAGMELFRSKWSYGAPGNRAAYFFQLFRRIISDGMASVTPFSYDEVSWEEI